MSISWKSRARSASFSGSQLKKTDLGALDTCELARGFGNRIERKVELFNQLGSLLQKLGFGCLTSDNWHGCPVGDSDRCFFTKQAAQILVYIISKAAASTDRHQPMPCSVSHCRLRPVRRTNTGVRSNPPVLSVTQKGNVPMLKNVTSQEIYQGETIPRLQMYSNYLVRE